MTTTYSAVKHFLNEKSLQSVIVLAQDDTFVTP